ncbi:MAG: hypothetical protein V3T61_05580, partial [Acidobacteriota bacterium]
MHSVTSSKKVAGLSVIALIAVGVFLIRCSGPQGREEAIVPSTPTPNPTFHRTLEVEGLDIFYREAGPEGAPTIL